MSRKTARALACAALTALPMLLSTPIVFAAGAGSSCSKIGTLSGTAKKPLVCKKIGKKLVWISSFTVPGVLASPTTATFNGGGINVVWSVPVTNGNSPIIGYRLEFSTPTTPWLFVQTMLSNQNSANVVDARLVGTTLQFRVAAVNAVGIGAFSVSNSILYGTSSGASSVPAPSSNSVSNTISSTTSTTSTTTSTVPAGTVSQRNAVSKGASYLRSSSFSRSGLISQLQYEGFSVEDATYGTDAQNADWNAQAVKKGASYLRSSSFSRSGLISQLQYEGFSGSEATYGTDSQNADWNAQAAKKAASYLRSSSFSRSGLISQLLYEGFSQVQAEYGVGTTGL